MPLIWKSSCLVCTVQYLVALRSAFALPHLRRRDSASDNRLPPIAFTLPSFCFALFYYDNPLHITHWVDHKTQYKSYQPICGHRIIAFVPI